MADQAPFPIAPKSDFIIIEVAAPEAVTAGGVIVPESAKEKSKRGTIRAVGPGKMDPATHQRVPMESLPGDEVLFNKFSGTEIMVETKAYLIMREPDIMATL